MTIRIFTLGSLRVLRGDEELAELPRQKLRCGLLVHLAMERRATRDSLAALLWPERGEERAKHSLSQALYELRQDLGPDVHAASGDLLTIGADVWIDALQLRDLIENQRWAEALELSPGPFLGGTHLVASSAFQAWVDRWQSRLARLHRRARSEVLARHRADGRLSEALTMAHAWVEFEPLDDEAHHVLIELLAESGRRGEALHRFREYESLLARELDVEPLEQTKALVERVRGSRSRQPEEPDGEALSANSTSAAEPRAVPSGGWTEEQLVAELVPDLEIGALLGRGLMAAVYLAREPRLRRRVAVKVLRSELARDTTSRLRFEREAQSAAKISHPHVATIFAIGALSSGTPYIVMEYVEGLTLAAHRASLKVMDVAEVRRVVAEVASALAAAHEQGVVHRDVRPANVLIEASSGRAVLSDFGVAALLEQDDDPGTRLTKTGEIVGHPIYLSPEQLAGDRVGPAADVYSLGMLAFELVTANGDAPDLMALARLRSQRARISDVRSDVGKRLEALIDGCLAAHPEGRPEAHEVARELANPLPDEPERRAGSVGEGLSGFLGRLFRRSGSP